MLYAIYLHGLEIEDKNNIPDDIRRSLRQPVNYSFLQRLKREDEIEFCQKIHKVVFTEYVACTSYYRVIFSTGLVLIASKEDQDYVRIPYHFFA